VNYTDPELQWCSGSTSGINTLYLDSDTLIMDCSDIQHFSINISSDAAISYKIYSHRYPNNCDIRNVRRMANNNRILTKSGYE